MNKKIGFGFCILFGLGVLAAESKDVELKNAESKNKESALYFLATKDQIQFRHQKLEYRIHDASSIQVGNLLISTQNLRLFLNSEEEVVLEAPLQLMLGGTLLIKDPLGKSLWSQNIDNLEELTASPSQKKMNLRTESGKYILGPIYDFQKTFLQSSFFNFCVFIENMNNRLQACTPNYSLQDIKGNWKLQNLEKNSQENTVLVNGVRVNEYGIIQFDQSVKSISLAARLASGLSLEIKTQSIELEPLDIYFDPIQELIHLKLREKSLTAKKVYPWSTVVSLKEPYLYVEAFGQAPLRQELSIAEETLPLPQDRPTLISQPTKTYSSSLSLRFSENLSQKLKLKTKGDTLQKRKGELIWTLRNLKKGSNKPHLIEVESQRKKFLGAIEVERWDSWVIALETGVGATSVQSKFNGQSNTERANTSVLQVSLDKYFDGPLPPSTSFLRWGIHGQYQQRLLTEVSSYTSRFAAEASYRLKEGFHHKDLGASIRVGILSQSLTAKATDLISARTEKAQWIGFKITHDGSAAFLPKILGTSYDAQLAYYPLNFDNKTKNSQLLYGLWQSRYNFNKSYFGSWKFQLEYQQWSSVTVKENSTLYEWQLGLGWQF